MSVVHYGQYFDGILFHAVNDSIGSFHEFAQAIVTVVGYLVTAEWRSF